MAVKKIVSKMLLSTGKELVSLIVLILLNVALKKQTKKPYLCQKRYTENIYHRHIKNLS